MGAFEPEPGEKDLLNQMGFGQVVNRGGNPDPRGALDDLLL